MKPTRAAAIFGSFLSALLHAGCKEPVLPAALITVTSVSPASDLSGGGTSVTITGTNFLDVTSVRIGAGELVDRTVVSSRQITGTTPAATNLGTTDVVVTSSSGSSGICHGCFTYMSGILVSIVPANASLVTGGQEDFTATVTNDPTNSGVNWGISGCSGGPAICGSLSRVTPTQATYTAPASVPPGTLGITATSVRDNRNSFTAVVGIIALTDGQIAFLTLRDGNDEIYAMNTDGTAQRNLTNNPAQDYHAVWSPDGSKILFETDRDGNREIYVMNADGSGQRNLTSNPALDCCAAWSPDGSRILFTSDRNGNSEVYVMNADGSGQRNLTNNPAFDDWAAWSPDGVQILFGSDREGNDDVYVMNADGSGQLRLTDSPSPDNFAQWSPDGTKIAFESLRTGNWEIHVMNADGTGTARLTFSPGHSAGGPVWSPDGSKILFVGESPSYYTHQIFVINADGTTQRQLTNFCCGAEAVGGQWSPDGTKIAFTFDQQSRYATYEIYVMNADRPGFLQLTNNGVLDAAPFWRPRGP